MIAAGDHEPDAEVVLADAYGLSFYGAWIPDLVERYGLNPPPG